MSSEMWFDDLIADASDLAAQPTLYGQETHGELHVDVGAALLRAQFVCEAAAAVDAFLTDAGQPKLPYGKFWFDGRKVSPEAETALLILHDTLNDVRALTLERKSHSTGLAE